MSTNGHIIFYDEHEKITLYKHWDGYPTDVLEVIAKTILEVKSLSDKDLRIESQRDLLHIFTGKIIGVGTTKYGAGIKLDAKVHDSKSSFEDILESRVGRSDSWAYLINPFLQNINVLQTNGEFDHRQKKIGEKGFVYTNPFRYLNYLMEDYQDFERQIIQASLKKIEELSWTVNEQKPSSLF